MLSNQKRQEYHDSFLTIVPGDFIALYKHPFFVELMLSNLRNLRDESVAGDVQEHIMWEAIGVKLLADFRPLEAIEVFFELYKKMCRYQFENNSWIHKGMPLVHIAECFTELNYRSLSRRYLMLTLVEDAIRDHETLGTLDIKKGGIYFRLKYYSGLTHTEINNYAVDAYSKFSKSNSLTFFPEYVLLRMNSNWNFDYPVPEEYTYYQVNPIYLDHLLSCLGDGTGIALENIAEYIMFSMPGCKTQQRLSQYKGTTDYDVVCSFDGPVLDFRSELGRYIICECKDWNSAADYTTMAKLARLLGSTKTNFGILFSKNGISGSDGERYASREQRKIFQDSGIAIIVVTQSDINDVIEGRNFIGLLRSKYETIRLDL